MNKEELEDLITKEVIKYGKAMQTETKQYPEFIVVDKIMEYVYDKE